MIKPITSLGLDMSLYSFERFFFLNSTGMQWGKNTYSGVVLPLSKSMWTFSHCLRIFKYELPRSLV